MAEVELTGFEDVDVSSFVRLDPGQYTMVIPERPVIEKQEDGKQYINLPMKVVDGPEQQEVLPSTGSTSPIGITVNDRYYLTDNAKWRVKKLLVSCGIITRDDKSSPIAQGKFDLDVFMGAKFPCNVGIQMNNGKEYRNYDPVI